MEAFIAGGHLILIRHILLCMKIHTLALLPVPRLVINKINYVLSTFLWSESNGKAKRKSGTCSKLCKPMGEGGINGRDLGEVQKAFFIKSVWRLLSVENL